MNSDSETATTHQRKTHARTHTHTHTRAHTHMQSHILRIVGLKYNASKILCYYEFSERMNERIHVYSLHTFKHACTYMYIYTKITDRYRHTRAHTLIHIRSHTFRDIYIGLLQGRPVHALCDA